ncbi:hypothetical protein K438DRAFT_1905615 [Mycena galopus ATCC 62051]|nr:hypothetical protein K438DRAFT_1905615 [Mycena galopus ATCC 62051]
MFHSLSRLKLLYALQKSHGLASLSTVRRHQRVPRLLPSIGIPTRAEIDANVNALLDASIKLPPVHEETKALPDNIVMCDGAALETKCRYCPRRDAVVGLCREHANRVKTTVSDPNSIEEIRTALFNPSSDKTKVCFGSDATVVIVAPHAREDYYSPIPNRRVTLADWIQTVLNAWKDNTNGERLHGPIWAIGSDGDAVFRRAKHIFCMAQEVDSDSKQGKNHIHCGAFISILRKAE